MGSARWLAFGNLNNGTANGGLSYLNGNNGLSNANWNYLARISDIEALHILSEDKIDLANHRAGRKAKARTNQKGISIKRYCKNIDITDPEAVYPWVYDCCRRHRNRYDFKNLLGGGDFEEAVREICKDACKRIKDRDLNLEKPQIRTMVDKTTGKIRQIGKESAMQQVFDYIAVHSSMEIFRARLVREQCSSITGRGQIYGKNMIKRWIISDNDAERYAKRHGYRYARKVKYFVKLDIHQCFPSADTEVFLELFEMDCANKDIVWLWQVLIRSHRVDGYTGFLIGALTSQWACQYMISFIYRYAKEQGYERRGKNIKAVTHMLIFMDDMMLTGSNRKRLKKAVENTVSYTKQEFGWEIKPNWHIRALDDFDIDMMGYVIHRDGSVTIRDRDFVKARRMFLRCQGGMTYSQAKRIMSYKGFFVHSDSRTVRDKYHAESVWRNASKLISRKERGNGSS